VLERERIDVAGLCRAAVETARSKAAEKAQKLEVEVSQSAGHVFGDARRLRESIEHVLQNAIAYTDRKGRISLSADGDKKSAVIAISDNGAGIAADDLPRVFDRFDRVAEDAVRGESALGLGLPLTRQFVEAHGGTVMLQSERGKGTTVTLTIPRGTR
jgi:signal transduction histidine kinase